MEILLYLLFAFMSPTTDGVTNVTPQDQEVYSRTTDTGVDANHPDLKAKLVTGG